MKKKAKKLKALIIITVSLFLFVSFAYISGLFDFLENKTYDFRVNFFAEYSRPSEDIMVIILDQHSLDWAYEERGWVHPLPRKAYSEFLDYMNIAGASSVMFDVLFTESSRQGEEDDFIFAKSSDDFGRAVQGVFFSTQSGRTFTFPQSLNNKPFFQLEGFEEILHLYDFSHSIEPLRAQFPIESLAVTAGSVASITGYSFDKEQVFRKFDLFKFNDQVYRRLDFFALFDGRAVPGLFAGGLLANGKTNVIHYDKNKSLIEWDNYKIPIGMYGGTLLRFRGSIDRYIPYSLAEILQSAEAYKKGEEPLLPPENFTGKHIFYAYYAPGLFDICTTPISSVYPGAGMHITMLDNLLSQDFIRECPLWLALLLIFLSIVLITVLVLYSNKILIAMVGGTVVFFILCVYGMFAYYSRDLGLWVPMVAPITGLGIAFFTTTLYNYATEGKQKQFIKSAFSQYLSPSVIDQLLMNPERLTLGGERREISIFFSDIQGFTSISEKLDPTQLTELLNDYLSVMTDIILESGGTIDKYEGDAIIAFWNAPVDYEDHAARALRASLKCQSLMAEKQEFFKSKFGCELFTRIGLNTGYAVVGNMGSGKRFDYTMIGDSVNLAARLEGLNKLFGTYLMCTETTFKQGGMFFGRKLAIVAVVGKKEPVPVWEPMPESVFLEKKALLQDFDSARDVFYQGNFHKALAMFQGLVDKDKPSFYYAEQCCYYIDHPEEWKGFWQATTK